MYISAEYYSQHKADCGPYCRSQYKHHVGCLLFPTYFLTKPVRDVFDRCEIQHGHAHRFRDTFAVGLLEQGASLYDVAKMLGINMTTAEKHYAPYVRELQDRAARLISGLTVPVEKVVQFCVPLSTGAASFDQTESEDAPLPAPAATRAKS
jgi:integrase